MGITQSLSADASPQHELKQRIVRFMSAASTEITPFDQTRLTELARHLRPGTSVHVAHTPTASLRDVVRAAVAAQGEGFAATPHIAARRIPNAMTLRLALAELLAGGVRQILLIAGDAPIPMGEFSNTLDVLDSHVLEDAGIDKIGVAGHPEGHKAVGPTLLWEALRTKQEYANRTGVKMHIVTQFSFNAAAMREWEGELPRHQIRMPVHVGIAGPAPLHRLIHYAMQCGIGASLRTVMRNLSSVGRFVDLAITPEQHLVRLLDTAPCFQVVAPHFFAFGGSIETARWISKMAAGEFEIESTTGKLMLWA
jgi:methylenetetrahydrofolate reductase (NADPH)